MCKESNTINRRHILKATVGCMMGASLSPQVFSKKLDMPDNRPVPPGKDPSPEQM